MLDQLESLSARVRLFIQANLPLENQHIGIMDMLDLIELVRYGIIDEVISEEIILKNKNTHIGGVYKYQGDKKQNFSKFWYEAEKYIQELTYSFYKREINLNKKSKLITPLMVKRFTPVIVHPLLEIFKSCGPIKVIDSLGSENDPFDWLRNEFLTVNYQRSEVDIMIAQKVITKYARGK